MDIKDLGISKEQLKKILAGRPASPKIIRKNISDKTFTFGMISDTHLCSRLERLDELHTFYEICRKEEIMNVIHCGDIVDGWGMFRGQENEVHTFGARNQAEYVIKHYPLVKGITTYFITGNHDCSWWNKSGVDIGELVADKRKDMIYMGQYQGDITLGDVKIRMLHPDGFVAYALSYRGQKISEQIPSGHKPHILVLGHFHTTLYFFYRLIHIFQVGCFQDQSPFLLRKGINPVIGGWTIKVRVAEDRKKTILSLTPTFIPFI